MAIEQVNVPDIGGSEGAEVIEILVAVGDTVELEQSLIVLESDKASMEIPSTAAGTVLELLVGEGDELVEGSPIIKVEVAGESADAGGAEQTAPEETEAAPEPEPPAPSAGEKPVDEKPVDEKPIEQKPVEDKAVKTQASAAPEQSDAASGDVYAGPAVRKLAREFGVPLAEVAGTGPQGRILKEDLHQFVQQSLSGSAPAPSGGAGLPVVPEVDFAKYGEVEVVQRSKVDKLTADNMRRSWLNVPHVTQADQADVTELEQFRSGLKSEAEQRGVKISPLPFVMKACAVALKENPKLNSSLARGGADLVYKNYVHIGMAVDTPAGLLVPVIRDVDRKSIWELAAEIMSLAARARDRKLTPADMQGGCFSVSSLGNIGGTAFTPIVNTPEVAILGVSKAQVLPRWDGEQFQPRTMLPLSLSYDHRVVNGGDGGRFLTRVVELLGDIRGLIL